MENFDIKKEKKNEMNCFGAFLPAEGDGLFMPFPPPSVEFPLCYRLINLPD